MKNNILGLAVATALSMTAFSAMADDMYRGSWYAVPGASYMNTDSELDADNGGGGFLAIGKELSPSWDIQGRLGYNRADEDLTVAGGIVPPGLLSGHGKYKQTTLGLDALYMFSRDKFRPFLLAGLGAARNDRDFEIRSAGPTNDLSGKKTSWLAGLGLGAQYLFNDNFGLQADLRHQWSRAKIENLNLTTLNNDTDTETIGNTLFNLGGIFRFGAPAPVVAEAAPEPAPVAAIAPEPEPAPAPAPEPVKCEPKMDTITVDAAKLFGYDKANLTAGGKDALDEAAAKIKASPEIKSVTVTGHTDRIGSESYNQKLSERRAKQVAAYLSTQGVDAGIISAVGKGESEPVVQCAGNKATKKLISCLQPNRRVEIKAEGQKETGCN